MLLADEKPCSLQAFEIFSLPGKEISKLKERGLRSHLIFKVFKDLAALKHSLLRKPKFGKWCFSAPDKASVLILRTLTELNEVFWSRACACFFVIK